MQTPAKDTGWERKGPWFLGLFTVCGFFDFSFGEQSRKRFGSTQVRSTGGFPHVWFGILSAPLGNPKEIPGAPPSIEGQLGGQLGSQLGGSRENPGTPPSITSGRRGDGWSGVCIYIFGRMDGRTDGRRSDGWAVGRTVGRTDCNRNERIWIEMKGFELKWKDLN